MPDTADVEQAIDDVRFGPPVVEDGTILKDWDVLDAMATMND